MLSAIQGWLFRWAATPPATRLLRIWAGWRFTCPLGQVRLSHHWRSLRLILRWRREIHSSLQRLEHFPTAPHRISPPLSHGAHRTRQLPPSAIRLEAKALLLLPVLEVQPFKLPKVR